MLRKNTKSDVNHPFVCVNEERGDLDVCDQQNDNLK
jgi:hypothetical protein